MNRPWLLELRRWAARERWSSWFDEGSIEQAVAEHLLHDQDAQRRMQKGEYVHVMIGTRRYECRLTPKELPR